jgi:hypothetical protein
LIEEHPQTESLGRLEGVERRADVDHVQPGGGGS